MPLTSQNIVILKKNFFFLEKKAIPINNHSYLPPTPNYRLTAVSMLTLTLHGHCPSLEQTTDKLPDMSQLHGTHPMDEKDLYPG